MNAQIRKLGIAMMVCYVALFAQLNRIQVFGAADLNKRTDNTREIVRDFDRPRGDITLADG
ncbi:MAG: penicillin-binding protein 2, partial [Actinobacteria bacterium]|nr:penicillin-binding protein 2 [Actinomycetota bacterium]